MSELNIEEPGREGHKFIGELSIEPAFFNSVEMELMPEMVGESEGHWGGLEEIVKIDSVRRASVMKFATDFLDRVVPLDGASHADVVRYTVEIPTRYARCFAELTDGRKVCFKKLRKFIGWSDDANKRSLLFRNNGLHIEIQIDSNRTSGQRGPGQVSDVTLESAMTTEQEHSRKFIGIDGGQILLPA